MKRRLCCMLLCLSLMVILPVFTATAAPEQPQITMQPQNYQYPQYSTALYSVKATGTNLTATWYLAYEGQTYNLSDNQNGIEPWEGYAGENYGAFQDGDTFSWFFGGIDMGLNGAEIWCVLEDGHYDITSDRAIITVHEGAMPPEILDMPAQLTGQQGDQLEARCVARSTDETQLEYIWYETHSGKLQDIMAIEPEETGDGIFLDTQTVGTRYYVCGITTSGGGRAYSAVLPVTVTEAAAPQPTEPRPAAPTEATTAVPEVTEPTLNGTEKEHNRDQTQEEPIQSAEEQELITDGNSAVQDSDPKPQPKPQSQEKGGTDWVLIAAIALGAAAVGAGVAYFVLKRKIGH